MSDSFPTRFVTHIKAGIVAYAKVALWKRDSAGSYTPASALASPQIFADDNASTLTGLRGGSIVSDASANAYIANASGVPKKILKAGDSFTFADSVVSYWGDGNDIGFTWDGTRGVWSQAAANSEIRWGVDGAGMDQIWYGDTASISMTWDQSADSLIFADSAKAVFGTGSDISVAWDGTRLNVTQAAPNSEIRYGVDGAGIDQIWYGDTASAYMLWDQSADSLSFSGTATLGVCNRSIGASTAAAGTTTSDAGVLPAGTAPVYPTTAADGTKGVRINAADQITGRTIFIGNGVGNQILKVYPPSGGNINGLGADAAFSTASGKGAIITCLSSGSNTWLAW